MDWLEKSGPFCRIVPELMTEDAKSGGRVIKTPGGLLRSDVFNEIAAEGFILAVRGILRGEEELVLGRLRYPLSSTDRHV